MKKYCRFYELKKVGSNALGGVFYSVTRDEEKQLKDYMLVEVREEYRRPKVWDALSEFFQFSRKLNHPNILTYDYWGKCKDGYYIATRCREFFSLTSILAQLKKKSLPFSFDIPIQAIFQLATGLQYLSNIQYKGSPILHNLITPDDIMISLDGVVYIANFGIYQIVYSTNRELANDLATERSAFLAPELISKKKPSPQADVYSVAALLYFLLTGKLVAQDKDLDQQLDEAKMIPQWEGGDRIPDGVKAILKKALSPAEQRYRNIGEFTEALEKFVDEEDITPTTFNLAYYMNTLFQEEKEERERLVKESRDRVPVEIIEEPEEEKVEVTEEEEKKKGFPVVLVSAIVAIIALVIVGIVLLRKPAQKSINQEELEKRINQLVEQKLKQKEEELRKQYEEKYGQLTAQKQEELKKALEEERKKLLASIRRQQMAKISKSAHATAPAQTPAPAPAVSPQASQGEAPAAPQAKAQSQKAEVPKKTSAEEQKVPAETKAPPQEKPQEAKPTAPSPAPEKQTTTKPAVIPGSVVSLSELDHPIKLIKRVAPRMPVKALRLRVRGSVMASILIDENGNVARVRIIRATPKGFFEEEAYRTLLKWKFTPPRKKGVPVKVWKVVTIQFK